MCAVCFPSKPLLSSSSTSSSKPITSHIIIPPEDIIYLYFDSVTTSLDSPISTWSGGSVIHFVFKIDFRNCHIAFFLLSNILLQYTTPPRILYHLHLLNNMYTNTLYNSLIVTPACSVNQHSSLELIMVSIIKPKDCIDTPASPNLVMVSSILP